MEEAAEPVPRTAVLAVVHLDQGSSNTCTPRKTMSDAITVLRAGMLLAGTALQRAEQLETDRYSLNIDLCWISY